MRPVVRTEEDAGRELDPRRPRVRRLKRETSLPFYGLYGDQFEELCSRLLKQERPEEQIVLRGATGDAGYDIARTREDGSVELIQCKCYRGSVSVGEVRKALAKIFVNLHSGEIPFQVDQVSRISFYVATNLTPRAENLLYPEKWKKAAEKTLSDYLRRPPSRELLDFALSWWPREGAGVEIGAHLSDRASRYPELRDEFFEVEKGIVGSEARFQPGTWGHFFSVAGQENVAARYLAHWPLLPPDQRFERPDKYSEILKSVHEHPLTFLIGPAASGKTFTAIQILWDAYCRGLHVRWIGPDMPEPTDGPVPAERGPFNMKRRIETLAHRLGLEPFQVPLDAHDFIASNLKPDSLVYIEDPFGKTDEEFAYSLHTYSFFDLDAFVSAIDDGAARAGCHILISSRHGFFDRWVDDRKSRGNGRPKSQLVRIGTKSYSSGQCFDFARKLAEMHGLAKAEDIADEIVSQIRLPYEIEKIILGLPKGAHPREAKAAAMSWIGDLREVTRRQLSTKNDAERLFLLVTALGGTRNDYIDLYRVMGIPGDGEETLEAALARYRPFIVRQSLPFFRGSCPVDEKFSSTHSSVQEAINDFLADHLEWAERVALTLPKSGNRYADLAVYLLSLGICKEYTAAQNAIASVLFDENGLSIHNLRNFMGLWATLSDNFKDRLFQHLESDPKSIVREVAAWLERIDIPSYEAWKIIRLLLREQHLAKSGRSSSYLIDGHPWKYLVRHFQEVPDDIRLALADLALQRPRLFTYVLGEALIEIWSEAPNEFKEAFFHRDSLESDLVQERVLFFIAYHWTVAPQELKDFFLRQAFDTNPLVRAKTARAAWLYWDTNPEIFDPIYMRAVDDPDISVPLEVLSGSGDDDYTRKFAEKLFVRADEEVAACMLQKFLMDGSGSQDEWKARMMKLCIEKGGELALGVLAAHHFARNSQVGTTLYLFPKTLEKELEIVRLGALHAYAHDHGERSYLSEDEAIALVKGMNYPYRDFALYYLSIQVVRLPSKVRAYVESFEEAEGNDGEAVRLGKEERQPEKGPQTIVKFLVRWIAAMLKSQEHPS